VSDSRASGLVLEGEDLAAARTVLNAAIVNNAVAALDGASEDPLAILDNLRKLVQVHECIGSPDTTVVRPLGRKHVKHLRRALRWQRAFVEGDIEDWARVKDDTWETDAHRSVREYNRQMLGACERLDAALSAA
jgi:hypothetical protein